MIGKLCICCCVVPIVLFGIGGITFGSLMNKWMNKEDFLPPFYTVEDAMLNKFSVTSNKTLDYDLALTMVVETKWTIYKEIKWEKLISIPVYENEELGKVDSAPIEIKAVGKKEVKPSYKGEKKMSVDASKVTDAKFVDILLKLEAKRSGKTIFFFKVKNEFNYECKLKVPTKSGGGKFESVRCERKKKK